jgi:hypothetical protein
MNADETATWVETFRLMIERAGAELVGVENGEILFRADAESPVCRLYPFAIRGVVDIHLALKNARESQMASAWELGKTVNQARSPTCPVTNALRAVLFFNLEN